MNNYQLLIDGERMILSEDIVFAVTRKNYIFSEIDKLQASLTTTIKLVKKANKFKLNFPEAFGSDTMVSEHKAVLYRGSQLLIDGVALISDDADFYLVNIYFDNFSILNDLAKIKLGDLDYSAEAFQFNNAFVETGSETVKFPIMQTQSNGELLYNNKIYISCLLPFFNMQYLFDYLRYQNNIAVYLPTVLTDFYISGINQFEKDYNYKSQLYTEKITHLTSPTTYYTELMGFSAQYYLPDLTKTMFFDNYIKFQPQFNNRPNLFIVNTNILLYDVVGVYATGLQLKWFYQVDTGSLVQFGTTEIVLGAEIVEGATFNFSKLLTITNPVPEGNYFIWCQLYCTQSGVDFKSKITNTSNISFDADRVLMQQVVSDFKYILPDMTFLDLVKKCCQVSNTIPFTDSTNALQFYSLNDIMLRDAENITAKIDLSKTIKVVRKIGDFGTQSKIQYDKTNLSDIFEIELTFENANYKGEKDIITIECEYPVIKNSSEISDVVANYRSFDIQNNDWSEFPTFIARIPKRNRTLGVQLYDNVDSGTPESYYNISPFNSSEFYAAYEDLIQIIQNSYQLELYLLISEVEFYEFDLLTPVYLQIGEITGNFLIESINDFVPNTSTKFILTKI